MGEAPRDAKTGLLELDDPTSTELLDAREHGRTAGPIPTLIPAYDPSEYAAEVETRERMPTLTDECALEQARLQSLPSQPPPRDAVDPNEQISMLTERLAPLSRVPTLAKKLTQLGALLEDPKTAYVLGFVDGTLPLGTIVEVTGLPELETLTVLDRMVTQSVIVFRSRP